MNRKEIETEYTVENGIITSPGKFENEPVYAPYFYDALLNGFADDDDGEYAMFHVTEDDINEFPELTSVKMVELYESSDGFVFCELTYKEEVK
jgi:hypothetical protein